MKDLAALIMAAGKGTRMVSSRAKVLHRVCGVPMLRLIYRATANLSPEETFVIIGHDADRVQSAMQGQAVRFIHQVEQLGTGHAMMTAREALRYRRGDLLVLFGDTPRIKAATLQKLVEHHRRTGAALTLLTTHLQDPFGYGRILREAGGSAAAIVEEKDATPEQRRIREVNPGFYCFQIPALLDALQKLTNDNAQREYYITDLIAIEKRHGLKVEALPHDDSEELKGVNTRAELAEASGALRREKNLRMMAEGVTLIDPERTYVELDVEVEKDVILYPMVALEGTTAIKEGATVRSGARITNSIVEAGAEILENCVITDSTIGPETKVGPFAHVREHTVVGARCRIGNFVEIKKSTLQDGTKAAHLAYLGDATIGKNVNIGAGVITCNYDGTSKHATIIEDNVFVGTDSQLVAPVRVGREAYVAAGSCITEDVPEGALAVARGRQVIKEGWVRRRKSNL
jgi:bifunctional UDP-N-acetylglucosamine pyrophosphorylase/glucosamine-1-phosphate N-acetyltransferase